MKNKSNRILKGGKINFLRALIMIGMFIPAGIFSQTVIEIQVSPNILNLQSNGVVVTIHTNIPYAEVGAQSVTLNEVVIQSWKADNRGFFVAKFNMDDIKNINLNIGEYNTLTLEGDKVSGGTFTGSEDVLVINNLPKGKN
ncbi:MAG: hypothetical protein K8S00_13795 [Bacteroidales bacterium]|nr:hypothetical protein [Bacteroidales bacterium]